MKKICALSLLASAGVAGIAMADDAVSMPHAKITPTAVRALDGTLLQQRGVSQRDNGVVYQNDAGGFFSSGIRPSWGMDDRNWTTGPAEGSDVLMTAQNPGFVAPTAGGTDNFNVVMVVEIYGTIDDTLEPADWRDPDNSFLGGYFLELTDIEPGFYYDFTAPIDLTGLPDGGINILNSDITVPVNGFSVSVYFFTDNTFTTLSTRATLGFSGNAGAGPGGTDGPQIGFSDDVYWRDADANGELNGADARFFGGAPNLANFGDYMEGEYTGGCAADFNGDGFVDGFDYDDFVACFEGDPCPPGQTADFNGDGFPDGFDYDDFVLAFEEGCL